MRDYFYGRFQSQIQLLEFKQPNEIVRDFLGNDALAVFGGRDWENVTKDLLLIPAEDRARFVLCLFMMVLIDQCLYARWRDAYKTWEEKTNYPKFGSLGFGVNNENPFKILWAPERENIVGGHSGLELMPEFVKFMKEETTDFLSNNLPQIQASDFFDSIKRDYAFNFDKGEHVLCFKKEFEIQTGRTEKSSALTTT